MYAYPVFPYMVPQMYAYPMSSYMVPWQMMKHAADETTSEAVESAVEGASAQPLAQADQQAAAVAGGAGGLIPPWFGHMLPPVLGAGLGALGGTLYTSRKPQEKRTRIEYIKNMLLGALLGGLGGIGASWFYNPFVTPPTSMPPALYSKLFEGSGDKGGS